MLQIGTILVDKRDGRVCQIENVQSNRINGTLYTLQYETGGYKRYYAENMPRFFYLAQIDRSNVIQVDFVLKRLVS